MGNEEWEITDAIPKESNIHNQQRENMGKIGVLNEYEVCKKLNIKPEKLEKYI